MSNDILISAITDDLNHLAHHGVKGQHPGEHDPKKRWQPQAKYAKGRQDPNKKLKAPMAVPKPATTTTTTTTSSSSTTFTSGSDSGFTSGNSSNSSSNKPRNNKPQNNQQLGTGRSVVNVYNKPQTSADSLQFDGTRDSLAEKYVHRQDYKSDDAFRAAMRQARISDYITIAKQIKNMYSKDPATAKKFQEKLDASYKDVLKEAKKYKI